jgi:hypothetical protein
VSAQRDYEYRLSWECPSAVSVMANQDVFWETLTAEEWDSLPWESRYRIADGGDIFTQRHTLELWEEHHHEPVRNVRFARRPIPDPDEGWDEVAERGATGVTHWKPALRRGNAGPSSRIGIRRPNA